MEAQARPGNGGSLLRCLPIPTLALLLSVTLIPTANSQQFHPSNTCWPDGSVQFGDPFRKVAFDPALYGTKCTCTEKGNQQSLSESTQPSNFNNFEDYVTAITAAMNDISVEGQFDCANECKLCPDDGHSDEGDCGVMTTTERRVYAAKGNANFTELDLRSGTANTNLENFVVGSTVWTVCMTYQNPDNVICLDQKLEMPMTDVLSEHDLSLVCSVFVDDVACNSCHVSRTRGRVCHVLDCGNLATDTAFVKTCETTGTALGRYSFIKLLNTGAETGFFPQCEDSSETSTADGPAVRPADIPAVEPSAPTTTSHSISGGFGGFVCILSSLFCAAVLS